MLFLGRFEYQKKLNNIHIDEIIATLTEKTDWHHLKATDETLNQDSYFTFSVR